MQADATVAMGGLQGVQAVEEGKAMAEQIKAQGAAAGQMGIADGIGSLASGIAGGFMNRSSVSPSVTPKIGYGFSNSGFSRG